MLIFFRLYFTNLSRRLITGSCKDYEKIINYKEVFGGIFAFKFAVEKC
jgi:hypothetical protein